MGSEVFDDVAFYYVITSMIASVVVPATLYIVWSEFFSSGSSDSGSRGQLKSNKGNTSENNEENGIVVEDGTGVNVDRKKYIEDKLKSRNLLGKNKSFRERFFKKRYACLLIGWVVLMYLLCLLPSMQTKGFVVFEPYSILGLELDASEPQIKKAYRKLAMQWHPDKHLKNKEEAEAKFTLIAKAYAALTDPKVKANMDRFGNPDGQRTAQSMTYGLPEFLSNKSNEIYVLIGYFVLFIILPIYFGYRWWKQSNQLHDSGVLNQTIGWYAGAVKDNMTMPHLMETFALAAEFREFKDQQEDKIEELKRLLQGQLREFTKHQYDNIYYIMTTSVTLHAFMQRVEIKPALKHELHFILSKLHSLAHVLLELSRTQRFFTPSMAAIDLMQCGTQAMWIKDSPLLQLPGLTAAKVQLLTKKGINTVADFRAYSRAGVIKMLGCSEAEYEEMAAFAKVLPVVQVDVQAAVPGEDDIRVDDVVEIQVDLTRRDDIFLNEEMVYAGKKKTDLVVAKKVKKDKQTRRVEEQNKIDNWDAIVPLAAKKPTGEAPLVVSEHFPISKREVWYVLLVYIDGVGSKREHIVVDMRTLRSFEAVEEVKFLMRAPSTPGTYNYELIVRCDSYVGCDVTKRISMKVDAVPVKGKATATAEVIDDEEEGLPVDFNDDDEESDSDDDEEEDTYIEEDGKWYYLGAPTFLEFVMNVVILSICGYFAYNFLHSRGLWQKFVDPIVDKVWVRIGPTVLASWEAAQPVAGPIVTVVSAALNRFMGVDLDLPMEIKIEKLQKARSKGMF